MRFRALDTNLLMVLDLLLEHRSVTRTAEILHLTQPTISNALSRLRAHFHDDLIVQIGRQTILTPLADRLRKPLQALLQQTDAVIAMRSTFDPARDARRFSIASSDYAATVLLHDVVRSVTKFSPLISIALDDIAPGAIELFERGGIDMCIIPEMFRLPQYPSQTIFKERFVCVVWNENRQIGEVLSLDDFVSSRHIVMGSRSSLPTIPFDEKHLRDAGIHRDVAVQVPTFIGVLESLIGTNFIATVQYRLALRASRYLPLRILEMPVSMPPAVEILHWHSHMDEDESSKWFRQKLLDAAAALDDADPQ